MSDPAEAFSAYVAARQSALLRTAYLLTGDHQEAEDLVQTALARTYLAWHRIRNHEAVDGYVRRTMVNEHTTWWRRAWRRREVSTDTPPDTTAAQAATSVAGPTPEDRDLVWGLVRSLPPRQRAAVVLRYYEDLTEAETADILGCSVGTVKSQTSRALAAMRRRMPEEMFDPATERSVT